MRAAGLKAIATVVESTAVLISSKHPSDPKLVNLITNRIRPLHLQRRAQEPRQRFQNHTRQTRAHSY
jgi:ATP phosphoribosyltransferase